MDQAPTEPVQGERYQRRPATLLTGFAALCASAPISDPELPSQGPGMGHMMGTKSDRSCDRIAIVWPSGRAQNVQDRGRAPNSGVVSGQPSLTVVGSPQGPPPRGPPSSASDPSEPDPPPEPPEPSELEPPELEPPELEPLALVLVDEVEEHDGLRPRADASCRGVRSERSLPCRRSMALPAMIGAPISVRSRSPRCLPSRSDVVIGPEPLTEDPGREEVSSRPGSSGRRGKRRPARTRSRRSARSDAESDDRNSFQGPRQTDGPADEGACKLCPPLCHEHLQGTRPPAKIMQTSSYKVLPSRQARRFPERVPSTSFAGCDRLPREGREGCRSDRESSR